MLAPLIPGLWVAACTLALAALLRRGGEPLPWRIVLAQLLLVLAVLRPVLFAGQVLLPLDLLRGFAPFRELPAPAQHGNFLQRDLLTLIAPARERQRETLLAGEWPLANPRVGAGVPLLADPQAQPGQPLVLLALPFAFAAAPGVTAALRLLVALLFSFLLLRRLGVGEAAALAGSLAWGCGGWLVLWLGWPLANSGALLPAACWAGARWLDGGRRRDGVMVALATAALALAGHPETVLYAFVLVAALVVAWALHRRRTAPSPDSGTAGRRWLGWAAATTLGLLLVAPVLLPTTAAAAQSQRAAGLAARATTPQSAASTGVAPRWQGGWSDLARGRWLPILAPNAFGNDRYLAYWGPENVNEDAAGFVGTTTLLLALLGLGGSGWRFPGEHMLQALLPLLLLLMALPAPLRALADRLPLALQSTSYYHRLLLLVGFVIALLATGTLARVARGESRGWLALPVALALAGLISWAYLAHPHPGEPALLATLRHGSLRWQLRFLAAAAGLLLLAARSHRLARATPWALAALIGAELLLLLSPANPAMPRTLALPARQAIAALQQGAAQQRMAGAGEVLPANVASLYGLADARVYDPMAPAGCAAALAPLQQLAVADLATGSPARTTLARAGVSRVLAPPDRPLLAGDGLRAVFRDGSATVYALPGAWPRTALRARAGGGRSLVTTLCQDGGWRPLADGRPVAGGRDQGAFLTAALPAGGPVHLIYRPPRFLAGCVGGAIAAGLLLLILLRPPRRSPSPVDATDPRQRQGPRLQPPDGPLRLHLGSGAMRLEGWVNVDRQDLPGVDLVADVTLGLPFDDGSVEAIFAEHFLEHLALDQAVALLGEAHRLLAPGGRLRLTTPNLEWVIRTHSPSEGDAEQRRRHTLRLNRGFYGWSHRFLWSRELLAEALAASGFEQLTWCRPGESTQPALRGLERHESYPDTPELPHVLVVEAGKGPAQPARLAALLRELEESFLRDAPRPHRYRLSSTPAALLARVPTRGLVGLALGDHLLHAQWHSGTVEWRPEVPEATRLHLVTEGAALVADAALTRRDRGLPRLPERWRHRIERRLLGPAGLAVARHPRLELRCTRAEPLAGGRVRLYGELTLRGVTREVDGELTVAAAGERLTGRLVLRLRPSDFGLPPLRLAAGLWRSRDETVLEVDLAATAWLPT